MVSSDSTTLLLGRLRAISRAAAAAGNPLPPEPALAEELGIGRPQLREALARLAYEGLLLRRPRAGTVVNEAALNIRSWLGHQEPFIDTLRRMGYTDARIELVSMRHRPLTIAELKTFAQPDGTSGLEIRKRWRARGTVHMLTHYVLPTPGATDLSEVTDPADPVFDLAERLLGSLPTWEVAHATAENATDDLAIDLEVDVGSAMLVLDLLGISANGQRLYNLIEHHVGGTIDFGFVRTFG
jgi:DNA-binding GntR family transcriptional regulator